MYEKFGFRRAKTALELFDATEEELGWLENAGFFLPRDYRFEDEKDRSDMKGPTWKNPDSRIEV